MDVNKNNETFQIINKYNSLVNYLNQVIGYNKLNQSDKNKIDDKFTELIPMLQQTVDNASDLQISNNQQLKLMLSRIINKNYKPIVYSDLVDVDESQIPNSGYIDVSGNTRDTGDILFGLDGDEDERPRPEFGMMSPPTFSTDTGLPIRNADLLPMYKADDIAEPGRYPYVIPGDIDDEERKEAPTERQVKIRQLEKKITDYEPTATTDTHKRNLLKMKAKLKKLREEEDATAIQGKGKHRGRPKLIKINKFNGTQNDSIYDILKNYAMPQLNFSLTTEAMDKKNDILYKKKK